MNLYSFNNYCDPLQRILKQFNIFIVNNEISQMQQEILQKKPSVQNQVHESLRLQSLLDSQMQSLPNNTNTVVQNSTIQRAPAQVNPLNFSISQY